MKKIMAVGFSIAGAVIGAGFATGKELLMFFPENGIAGNIYLAVSFMTMFITASLFCSKRESENIFIKKTDKFFELIFYIFTGATFSVMLSCGGETLYELFGISVDFGVVITYIICMVITFFGISGVYFFNSVITPAMLFCIISVCIRGTTQKVSNMAYYMFKSVSYSGFNLLTLLPFMKNISIKEKKKIFVFGSFFGFLLVTLCGITVKMVVDKYSVFLTDEIPMLKIASLIDKNIGYFYGVLIYFAVLTTAVSCIFSLSEVLNKYLVSFPLLFIAFFGFEILISKVYTFFGYIGMVYIIYILLTVIFFENGKELKKHERRKRSDSKYNTGEQR